MKLGEGRTNFIAHFQAKTPATNQDRNLRQEPEAETAIKKNGGKLLTDLLSGLLGSKK